MERVHVTDYLIGIDQEIPDCLIKFIFLGEAKSAIRSVIKSRLGIMDFRISDAILGPVIFSLKAV